MISSQRVRKIVEEALYKAEELSGLPPLQPPDGRVIGNGVVRKFAFHPERLNAHRAEVIEMLKELDSKFMLSGGGGWSFIQMPFDKAGSQWGEQPDAGDLCAVANALGLLSFPMPSELWYMLPGAVPYVLIHDDKF